ncbi:MULTISPECIES: glutamate racemase [Cyanophyceae]|uniref:Glutamate racemase n=1 Tax=Picosynechococcus sp. (strain ATCC 27264 / PCC 7002 / PR-6) TaxID=32049 RepID=MURI_PICP2|nr:MULTISPECIES: glutamate racemase [Cyanophyceae]B1XPV8.1 RecName: Full=Glutamate racemase [Picosynechococcus sp. PCC 7002]ACA98586.1 glutamate racemase [Picosynechococcus sp. PCC 7002]SMH40742.1 glutamate racemase [Picosynechococcus sp. OG1]SMQ78467.1 glutamate racemase [Synechococcus sp. 7002]
MGNQQQHPIGIFDSGLGGITVLRALYRQLPQESIIYFADTARLPYGDRSPEELIQYVREILTWMEAQGVKMVVMACNTSSAIALDVIRSEFKTPVLGLILPGARGAVSQGKRIGVIATQATVNSGAYENAILEANPEAAVWQMPCPEFVPLIEANRINDPHTKRIVQKRLQPLLEQGIDTLVYGCTHYRHLSGVIQSILPSHVICVDPAEYVVSATEQELELMGWKNPQSPLPTRFAVSGCPDQFAQSAKGWLGHQPLVEQVDLKNLIMNASPLSITNG